MPTEDWIQESLARLESLEEERTRHEAALETSMDPAALRMNAQAIERLDAKIRSLYAELEAAAEQGDAEHGDAHDLGDASDSEDEDEDDVAGGTTQMFRRSDLAAQAAAMRGAPQTVKQVPATAKLAPATAAAPVAAAPRVTPVAAAAAPVRTPAPVAAPFSAAPAAAPAGQATATSPFGSPASPFGEVPQSAPFGSSTSESQDFGSPMSANSFDSGRSFDDESSAGSGSKMGIIIGAAVVVVGLVAYLAFGGKGEETPVAAPAGPIKTIGGKEVPPDTQGPKTVQGSSDAIKGTQYKEGRPQPTGSGGTTPRPGDKPAKKDPRAKIENADDPLAGIDK